MTSRLDAIRAYLELAERQGVHPLGSWGERYIEDIPDLLVVAEAARDSHASSECFDTCGAELTEAPSPCSCGCVRLRSALSRLDREEE